jgi:ATP-binding cassette subfamily C protein
MRRELRLCVSSLPRRPLLALAAWSVPEALPTACSGLAVAHALDDGFLARRPLVGLAWLGVLLLTAGIGAVGTRQAYRCLGGLVEPFRDGLVRQVVDRALRHRVAGHTDDGAVARLTHQVEIVRDAYAGLIVIVRSFAVLALAAVVGLLAVAPVILLLVLPPFLVGVGAFVGTLGLAAARQRAYVGADERLAVASGVVLAGVRDLVAHGGEEFGAALVAGPVREQAVAERALARMAVLRTLTFAIGGWAPLVALLAAAPTLVAGGLTTGAVVGGLTYVLRGLQPALGTVVQGVGGSGMRLVVTLGRILDAPVPPADARPATQRPVGSGVDLRDVTFAYGPHAEPVLRGLNLQVPPGDHLAVVGPSGVGKSTLAGLVCGLLSPDAGVVLFGGVPVRRLGPAELVAARVLIPQEAYVFTGTVRENLIYLHPAASPAEIDAAAAAVGADSLVARLGGYEAVVRPDQLSAGELQLLALARAYLVAAPVTVLDEATCYLDPAAERRAEEAFATRGGTLIVIAHRVSSALRARRVLVLDGVSAALGTHDELLDSSPLYRDLLGHWSAEPVGVQTHPAS